jgi:hypothetical protein
VGKPEEKNHEVSSPHSKVPATCPNAKPERFSPCPHITLLEDPFQYYPPIYIWNL